MRNKILILLAIVAAIIVLVPAAALAKPKGVPAGAKLVVNVTCKVTNDEDSGMLGYWALANYNKHVQVWTVRDGSFLAIVRYVGKWRTFAGALSPNAGTLQSTDGWGKFKGGYRATFTASDFTRARGNVGTYDFGGTREDILLGTYGAGQAGPTVSFDWLTRYFPASADFEYLNWGWTYRHQTQRWFNLSSGTSGDILL
jgi:hypothetical protein